MAEVTLREVTRANWREALALAVRPEQQRFVADHVPIAAIALAKAYIRPGGRPILPLASYAGETMVGFLNLVYEPESVDCYWLYHFFIDQRDQGRGYGRATLAALVALLTLEHPACQMLNLTVHPENEHAQRLYTAFGFVATGAMHEGEPAYQLDLRRAPA